MTSASNLMIRWILPGLVAAAIAGGFLYSQWPLAGMSSAPDREAQRSEVATTPASSGDVVTLRAYRAGDGVEVELTTKDTWHINANPASLDFLIPTEVEITAERAGLPTQMTYPPGHRIEVGLEKPIDVYSGRSIVAATLPARWNSVPLNVNAKVQACNDSGRCLVPSTLSATLSTGSDSRSE